MESSTDSNRKPNEFVVEEPIMKEDDMSIEKKDDYPSSIQLVVITFAVNLAMFLVGLDNTIISIAIPKITDHFRALDDVGWYASADLLTTCALQLMWGKLYTFNSIKWTYMTALFLFELGFLICAVASSSTTLIVGCAIAGVGPLVGGAFTDNPKLTWRWCFYINLPLGGCVVAVIFFFLTSPTTSNGSKIAFKEQLRQIDLPGTIMILFGVICLLLALQWGGTSYAWKNGRIIALLILAGILLVSFVIVQICSGERATVPTRIPMWFQAIKGVTAIKSGVMSLPMVLSFVIFSFLGGILTTKTGYYTQFFYLSVILMSVGTGLLSRLKFDPGYAEWIGYQVIFGTGCGLGLQAAFTAAQTALSLADVPIGTAIGCTTTEQLYQKLEEPQKLTCGVTGWCPSRSKCAEILRSTYDLRAKRAYRGCKDAKNVICDFGEAKELHTPILLVPPETFFGEPIDMPVNIWTVASRIYEILSERPFFEGPMPGQDHVIAEMISTLGPLPSRWWENGP
ncbi:efflux pump antibiotic resistance protein, putative [Talaromyces stipitatus ATCC 10500]|uniref:Efflux pump antibiotic resistance protein, putative n=1 Tax=Talaromyces stipitatus (strain ATCC 10500 / CBS 375.48 / QM 6759 / NRRL 1006) TaxID=441959 RepID=B8MCY8_TALSN|nr:efflux pump antibiotic resistance protein, putative [Talaromyces stipitatus ATCC 10500]EED17514.1 efflux pump antibiotic resistance protein, putative [Talaromyces stipitatus ATCC 10500]